MAISQWTLTKQYADDTYLTEAQLDAGFNSGVTWSQGVAASLNTSMNNITQLTKDAFGTAYTLDGDGNADRTNTLYNKQSLTASYNTSITLGTTVAGWTEATAAARMIFTPEATGKYHVSYQFTWRSVVSTGNLGVAWGIFNKTSNATLIGVYSRNDPGGSGVSMTLHQPIHLSKIVNFSSTAAATISLYLNVLQSSATRSHEILCSATYPLGIYGQIHKI